MKINSISLDFSDIDTDNASLNIKIDPPLAEGTHFSEVDFENQPCLALVGKVLAFLSFLKSQEKGTEQNGGPGENIPTLQ